MAPLSLQTQFPIVSKSFQCFLLCPENSRHHFLLSFSTLSSQLSESVPSDLLPVLHPGNSQGKTSDGCQAHIICFPFLSSYCSSWLMSNVLKTNESHISFTKTTMSYGLASEITHNHFHTILLIRKSSPLL